MLLHEGRVGCLILRFGDGSGTVLAAIDGYIANVVVDDGRRRVTDMPAGSCAGRRILLAAAEPGAELQGYPLHPFRL
jgi:hypothetical protein